MIRNIPLSVLVMCLVYKAVGADGVSTHSSEGQSCLQNGVVGECTRFSSCSAVSAENRSQWWKFNICGFVGFESVICCVPTIPTTTTTSTTTTPKPVATTPPMGTTTTEYIPNTYDYVINDLHERLAVDGCAALRPEDTTEPTGNKSWDKCLEYQRDLIYPCEESKTLMGGKSRANHCNHNADELIVGGVDAKTGEFPHMVLLGYGQTNGTAVWQCGGTLISDRFILTAGHCTRAKGLGYVNYAIVGSNKRTDNVNYNQVYRIKQIFRHPQYRALSRQNDIALLETVGPIKLDATTVPACLDVFGGDHSKAVATGWGATSWLGSNSDSLQKVTLTKFTDEECHRFYPYSRHMRGFDPTTQVCYGDYSARADTCQGDSGGPLTIKNHRLHCMYTVVGVTSFGKQCGNVGVPGWYTKVAHYVPWIEGIVWPEVPAKTE